MPRHICVHGHFYQPPRENPWLESVEPQDGAYPYHDWNERITDECYAQNAASRVLDRDGRIVHIVNNYERISFNVGPTLLAWLESAAPETYGAMLAADRASVADHDGHGSALAQAYGHAIMPLADGRDRRTQVRWGIADFVHRFGRRPEGMWLPETAVDTATLEVLAAHDIVFTILEPGQAARVRRLGADVWRDVGDGTVDTTMPYLVRLPSGAEIAVFFYDGPTSRAVAFEGLLADGAAFARRLTDVRLPSRRGAKLVNIATDGESYGHHHRHGDMALAYALHELEHDDDVVLTNYAAFLAANPPTHEVEIAERTSWSCAHGVERWRSDCGCADGGHPDWHQRWRAPLRAALDWLRDELAPRFERASRGLLHDPWAARDAYIDVVLERSRARRARFLETQTTGSLDEEQQVTVWKLLEVQRHALLMYTSCGWFFDDLGRIETVQVLRYAARAIDLARDVLDVELEERFVGRLAAAESNDPAIGDGRGVWATGVRGARVGAEDVAAHYAVSSLFEDRGRRARVHCYEVIDERRHEMKAADARLAVGRIDVRSVVTRERSRAEYGVVHLGDHNLSAGVRPVGGDERLDRTVSALGDPFGVADLPETLRRLEAEFGPDRYTLSSLFRDEQRRILHRVLDEAVAEARAAFRDVYDQRAPLMRHLAEIDAPVPRPFLLAAEVAVNDALRRAFREVSVDPARIRALLDDARTWSIELDTEGLALVLSGTIERLTDLAASELPQPALFDHFGEAELDFFEQARTLVDLARTLPFEVDLWRAQNLFHEALRTVYPSLLARAESGDAVAAAWAEQFRELGDALAMVVEP